MSGTPSHAAVKLQLPPPARAARGEGSGWGGVARHTPKHAVPADRPPSPRRGIGRCGGELPVLSDAMAFAGRTASIHSVTNTASRSRSAIRPSFPFNFLPSSSEGAGNAGRPMRPIAACATIVVERTRVSQVTPESPGIPRAMVLRLIRALPGDLCLVATVVRGTCPATLAPASERQDHTTSPSASGSPVKRAARVHRIPLRVS